jgi:hypothetical protein
MRLLGYGVALIGGSASKPFECSPNTPVRLAYSCVLASLCLIVASCSNIDVLVTRRALVTP